MRKRKGYNPKRKLVPKDQLSAEELNRMADDAVYGGNPEHKKNGADYGLDPPSSPRKSKALCDGKRQIAKTEATQLLKDGFRRGLISVQRRGNWPQNVWSISSDNEPFEAQLENQLTGAYHGYPIPRDDDFGVLVQEAWQKRAKIP
ncbi:MAG: hypothetical protein RIB03_11410 [Henriciella sp.]|uniref:hypothetical protein n=1 Tax=Henriciella sp. TaxID=1968823 RepID=UPI0032EE4741